MPYDFVIPVDHLQIQKQKYLAWQAIINSIKMLDTRDILCLGGGHEKHEGVGRAGLLFSIHE